jgi:hypothetical protein
VKGPRREDGVSKKAKQSEQSRRYRKDNPVTVFFPPFVKPLLVFLIQLDKLVRTVMAFPMEKVKPVDLGKALAWIEKVLFVPFHVKNAARVETDWRWRKIETE